MLKKLHIIILLLLITPILNYAQDEVVHQSKKWSAGANVGYLWGKGSYDDNTIYQFYPKEYSNTGHGFRTAIFFNRDIDKKGKWNLEAAVAFTQYEAKNMGIIFDRKESIWYTDDHSFQYTLGIQYKFHQIAKHHFSQQIGINMGIMYGRMGDHFHTYNPIFGIAYTAKKQLMPKWDMLLHLNYTCQIPKTNIFDNHYISLNTHTTTHFIGSSIGIAYRF
jgi:hypothetical protein